MNYRLFCISVLLVAILLVVDSCTSCDSKKDSDRRVNPMVEKLDNTPDEAMLVKLNDVNSEYLNVTVLSLKEKKTFSYVDAKMNGMIKGSLTVGDTLSIFPQNQSQTVSICINTSELSGIWFYDMAQHRGFKFEHGGGLSSINTETIAFREWKLLNGKLYIYFIDMQQVSEDRHEYEVEEANIISLDKHRLVLQFHGQTLSCQRQLEAIKFHL